MPLGRPDSFDSGKAAYAMNEAELLAAERYLEDRVSHGAATGHDVTRLKEVSDYLRAFHEARERIREREAAAGPDAP